MGLPEKGEGESLKTFPPHPIMYSFKERAGLGMRGGWHATVTQLSDRWENAAKLLTQP